MRRIRSKKCRVGESKVDPEAQAKQKRQENEEFPKTHVPYPYK
jgi:hypothetical protein